MKSGVGNRFDEISLLRESYEYDFAYLPILYQT